MIKVVKLIALDNGVNQQEINLFQVQQYLVSTPVLTA